jgi:hypothetical protein
MLCVIGTSLAVNFKFALAPEVLCLQKNPTRSLRRIIIRQSAALPAILVGKCKVPMLSPLQITIPGHLATSPVRPPHGLTPSPRSLAP